MDISHHLPHADVLESVLDRVRAARQRKGMGRKCSVCGETSHSKNKCPQFASKKAASVQAMLSSLCREASEAAGTAADSVSDRVDLPENS